MQDAPQPRYVTVATLHPQLAALYGGDFRVLSEVFSGLEREANLYTPL